MNEKVDLSKAVKTAAKNKPNRSSNSKKGAQQSDPSGPGTIQENCNGSGDLYDISLSVLKDQLDILSTIDETWVDILVPGQFQEDVKRSMNEEWALRMLESSILRRIKLVESEKAQLNDLDLDFYHFILTLSNQELSQFIEAILWKTLARRMRTEIKPSAGESRGVRLDKDSTIQLLGHQDLPNKVLAFFKDNIGEYETADTDPEVFKDLCIKIFHLWVLGWDKHRRIFIQLKYPFHSVYNSIGGGMHEIMDEGSRTKIKSMFDRYFNNNESFMQFLDTYLNARSGG